MSATSEMAAQSRSDAGTGTSRRLRRAGLVPGIVYGGGRGATMISLDQNELKREIEREGFFSSVLSLRIDGMAEQVVLKDLQRHPARALLLHVDFQRVRAGEKIHMTVPLRFLNEAESVGVKGGCSVLHVLTELDVVCLPKHLPEAIDIDMAELDLGDIVAISDVSLPEGVELDSGVDPEERVASVVKIEEQETEEPEPEPEGGEVIEGEAPGVEGDED